MFFDIFQPYGYGIEKKNLPQKKFLPKKEAKYGSKNWGKNWGGELCFYLKNPKNKKMPGRLYKKIQPKFNSVR